MSVEDRLYVVKRPDGMRSNKCTRARILQMFNAGKIPAFSVVIFETGDETDIELFEFCDESAVGPLGPVTAKPTTALPLEDFVGSDVLIKLVRYQLQRCRDTKTPFPHHVFAGGRGMGKRTLAHAIATDLGTEFQQVDCRIAKTAKDILPFLSNASWGSILMLSNADALTATVSAFFEPVFADFRVDITMGDGFNARTVNMKLQHFTILATTENSNAVPALVRTAFTTLEFGPVPPSELANLICRHIKRLPHELALMIVEECNPAPSEAVQITKSLIDYGNAVANGKLSRTIIRQALSDLGLRPKESPTKLEFAKRETIPGNVRDHVWQRDRGQCVRCGSQTRLEYDHMIPVSKGGSNTARNIQLLCESCNRRKGASISLFD